MPTRPSKKDSETPPSPGPRTVLEAATSKPVQKPASRVVYAVRLGELGGPSRAASGDVSVSPVQCKKWAQHNNLHNDSLINSNVIDHLLSENGIV